VAAPKAAVESDPSQDANAALETKTSQDTQKIVPETESDVGSDKPLADDTMQESQNAAHETSTQNDQADSKEMIRESQSNAQEACTKSDQLVQNETCQPSFTEDAAAVRDTQDCTIQREANETNVHLSSQDVVRGTPDVDATSDAVSQTEHAPVRSVDEGVARSEGKDQVLTSISESRGDGADTNKAHTITSKFQPEVACKDGDSTSPASQPQGEAAHASASGENAGKDGWSSSLAAQPQGEDAGKDSVPGSSASQSHEGSAGNDAGVISASQPQGDGENYSQAAQGPAVAGREDGEQIPQRSSQDKSICENQTADARQEASTAACMQNNAENTEEKSQNSRVAEENKVENKSEAEASTGA
jgi:hypothetical protein